MSFMARNNPVPGRDYFRLSELNASAYAMWSPGCRREMCKRFERMMKKDF